MSWQPVDGFRVFTIPRHKIRLQGNDEVGYYVEMIAQGFDLFENETHERLLYLINGNPKYGMEGPYSPTKSGAVSAWNELWRQFIEELPHEFYGVS